MADDDRFVALNIHGGVCADDDPCTANGYVTALEAAAGGLGGRPVLVLGLGPVGRAASRRLAERGAQVLAVEPHRARAAVGRGRLWRGHRLAATRPGGDRAGLRRHAGRRPDRRGPHHDGQHRRRARRAQRLHRGRAGRLGARHIHEPLAVGVAVMAVEALSGRVSTRA